MSRTSALKVLDHAMIGPEGADNCQKFVDILGLGRIFPLFIKTPKAQKKAGPNRRELEGEYCAIVHCFIFGIIQYFPALLTKAANVCVSRYNCSD